MKKKKKNTVDRLDKGDVMYFISSLTYKVVQTRDCYFPSDDDRFLNGNYFPEAKAAHACSDEVIELFVPRLNSIKKLQDDNLEKYIRETKDITMKIKKLMYGFINDSEDENAKPRRRRKTDAKPDFEPFAIELVDALTAYNDRNNELVKQTNDTKKEIDEFIRIYPK